ncbi:MAG: type II toxin-antitoxin system RelE/ParE family toxin [Parachlamydiales bacterium]|nr:type II toxin-antitoxin system RelE/ParE family toxin [Parachlamydiales bacterium]
MNNLNNGQTINNLSLTFDLIKRNAKYDKNLKMLPKDSSTAPATPLEIISKVFEEVKSIKSLGPTQEVNKETWDKLLNKAKDFIADSQFTEKNEKEQANIIFNEIFLHARSDINNFEVLKVSNLLQNIYIELDNIFSYFCTNCLAMQLSTLYVDVVAAGVKCNFSAKDAANSKDFNQLTMDNFTFDFQSKNSTVEPLQKESLKAIFDDINVIAANKDIVDINFVEDTVYEILSLKQQNKSLAKSCDQILLAFDFILKFNERKKFVKNTTVNSVNYAFFPKEFVNREQILKSYHDECVNIKNTGDHHAYAREFNAIQIKYLIKQREALKDIAYPIYQRIGDPERVEKFHERLRKFTPKLNFFSSEDIDQTIFQQKTRKLDESWYTEIITPSLITSLNKKIIKDKKKLSAKISAPVEVKELPSEKISAGKLEVEKQVVKDTDFAVEKKPINIVEEMIRLNSPKNSPTRSPRRSPNKSSPKSIKNIAIIQNSPKKELIPLKITEYKSREDKLSLYKQWFNSLEEVQKKIVAAQVENFKIRQKNAKPLDDGLHEIRVRQYELRVYFKYLTTGEIILLGGGNKASQKADIIKAKAIIKSLGE